MDEVDCPTCGEAVPVGRFCRRCGAALSLAEQVLPPAPPPADEPADDIPPPPVSPAGTPVPISVGFVPAAPDVVARSRRGASRRSTVVVALFVVAAAATAGIGWWFLGSGSDSNSPTVTTDPGVSIPVGAVAVPVEPSQFRFARQSPVAISVASCPGLLAFVEAESCVSLDRGADEMYALVMNRAGATVSVRGFVVRSSSTGISATQITKGAVDAPYAGTGEVEFGVTGSDAGPSFVVRSVVAVPGGQVATTEFIEPVDGTLVGRGIFVAEDITVAEHDMTLLVASSFDDGSVRLHTVYPQSDGWLMVVELLSRDQADRRLTVGSPVTFDEPLSVDGAPATTVPPDPEVLALAQLESYVSSDRSRAQNYDGLWVTQLSAKRIGTVWRGVTYNFQEILRDHELQRSRYGAILLKGSEWNFGSSGGDLWVSIVPDWWYDSYGALQFCYDYGIGREDCFAKLLRSDGLSAGSVEYP
jgi:hypothetical protein